MKTLIAALFLLPNLATAHSVIRCQASGGPGGVRQISILSADSLLAEKFTATVNSTFRLNPTQYQVEGEQISMTSEQVTLKLRTLDEQPIEAVLTLAIKDVTEAPALREASGAGALKITADPNGFFLVHDYTLIACQGLL